MKKISLFLMAAVLCAAILSVATPAQARLAQDPPYPVPTKVVVDSAWVRDGASFDYGKYVATAYRDDPFVITRSATTDGNSWSYGSLWRGGSIVAYGWIPTDYLRPV
ncbi:hypothetical protein [Fodinicola acaciae]|uniref:hypothetical protein n=1 Tax=Fodinicola acaciae TaxID=2681555 RepID=UPI0013D7123C|nr:hypothetical protein [Fodinicola acaciae]